MDRNIVVLKFGHSILKKEGDIAHVVAETYLYLRQGYKVIVVVSAIGNSTNHLSTLTQNIFASDAEYESDCELATLLATGEIASSSLVTIGFKQAGIMAFNLDYASIKTDRNILDALPLELELSAINSAFTGHDVLVLPGFIGVNEIGQTTLLGRGGSDLSAIFVANKIQASKCVLYKDSGSIIKDTNIEEEQQQEYYTQISYADCLNIAYPVVQHKALAYAEANKQYIYVKGIHKEEQTIIGTDVSKSYKKERFRYRHKILLLGLGTVGFGVLQQLTKQPELFEIVGIGVQYLAKHQNHGISSGILSDNIAELLARDYDILIELVGGNIALNFISKALQQKRHVVTANKLVIAGAHKELQQLAVKNHVILKYSAAVAGVIPILETIAKLKQQQVVINEVSGILNGCCNFILGLVRSGIALDQAIIIAQQQGYAEADPSLDIDGIDAGHKITIIAFEAFGCEIDELVVTGITEIAKLNVRSNHCLKLIATVKCVDDIVTATVKVQQISNDDPIAQVNGANNCVIIKTVDGKITKLYGKGAGRWPTTLSVYADILDVIRNNKDA